MRAFEFLLGMVWKIFGTLKDKVSSRPQAQSLTQTERLREISRTLGHGVETLLESVQGVFPKNAFVRNFQ